MLYQLENEGNFHSVYIICYNANEKYSPESKWRWVIWSYYFSSKLKAVQQWGWPSQHQRNSPICLNFCFQLSHHNVQDIRKWLFIFALLFFWAQKFNEITNELNGRKVVNLEGVQNQQPETTITSATYIYLVNTHKNRKKSVAPIVIRYRWELH